MTSPKALDAYHAVRARAAALWPDAFTPRGTPPVALRLGVHEDMSALRDEMGAMPLRNFMRAWTGRPEYLAVVAAGGVRHGLDGGVCGAVTPEEVATALARMSVQKSRVRKVAYSMLDPIERARRERQSEMDRARHGQAAGTRAAGSQAA